MDVKERDVRNQIKSYHDGSELLDKFTDDLGGGEEGRKSRRRGTLRDIVLLGILCVVFIGGRLYISQLDKKAETEFRQLDTNRDNYVTYEELEAAFPEGDFVKINSKYDNADRDRNGMTLGEFKSYKGIR